MHRSALDPFLFNPSLRRGAVRVGRRQQFLAKGFEVLGELNEAKSRVDGELLEETDGLFPNFREGYPAFSRLIQDAR